MKKLITLSILLTLMLSLVGTVAGSTTLNFFANTSTVATPYTGATQSNFTIDWQNASAPMGTAKLQLNWTDAKANYTMQIQSQNATDTVFYYHFIGLPAGTIQVKFYGSDSAGFENVSTAVFVTVAKGNLTERATLNVPDVTYPAYLKATASSVSVLGASDVSFKIYCDGTLVASSTGSMPSGSVKFNTGNYACVLNSTGGVNWNTAASIATDSGTVDNNLMLYGTIGTIIGAGVILLLLRTFVAVQLSPKEFIEAIVAVAIIVLIVITILTTFL